MIATSAKDLAARAAVAWYQQLLEVDQRFRQRTDVRALRPIEQRGAPRVQAHLVVAALAVRVQRLREKRWAAAGVDWSGAPALPAAEGLRRVEFDVAGTPRRGVRSPSVPARKVLSARGSADTKPPVPAGAAERVS